MAVALAVAAEARAAGINIDVSGTDNSGTVKAAQFRLFEAKLLALVQAQKQAAYETRN
jgi:hypothetical protein